jgi:ABC-2 type transport system permease protein
VTSGQTMNSEPNAVAESPASGTRSQSIAATRPYYFSVLRELWENRSIYVAPLIVMGVVLFGFIISAIGLPERRRAVLLLDPGKARAAIEIPYDVAAMMIMFTGFIVGIFYCLDALYGERRDRSVLFWKSLPVADLTTVLSKATVPLVILPLITFAIVVVTQVLMMLWTSVVLLAHGMSPASTWTHVNLFWHAFVLLYSLIALSLWHAPIYGWLLLVSGWVRRATFLWAVLPFIALSMLERIVFNTSHVPALIKHRVFGFAAEAFAFDPLAHQQNKVAIESLVQLTPGRYLSSAGLWVGLMFAAAFVAAAVRLRRYRDPV